MPLTEAYIKYITVKLTAVTGTITGAFSVKFTHMFGTLNDRFHHSDLYTSESWVQQ